MHASSYAEKYYYVCRYTFLRVHLVVVDDVPQTAGHDRRFNRAKESAPLFLMFWIIQGAIMMHLTAVLLFCISFYHIIDMLISIYLWYTNLLISCICRVLDSNHITAHHLGCFFIWKRQHWHHWLLFALHWCTASTCVINSWSSAMVTSLFSTLRWTNSPLQFVLFHISNEFSLITEYLHLFYSLSYIFL